MTEPNKQEFVSASKDANKQVIALAKEHGLWPDHDEVKERFVDGSELKESIEAFAADLLSQNKQPPAEVGEGAVAWLLDHVPNHGMRMIATTKEQADRIMNMRGEKPYDICIPLGPITSQTTATQAAVAAVMRKCAEIATCNGVGTRVFEQTIADEILAAIPAEANAALEAYVQEKCMEVAQAVMDYYLLEDGKGELHQEPIPTIVSDVLNKNREG
jgi:hypothetical protein